MATIESKIPSDDQSDVAGSIYDGFISYSHAADDLLAPRLQAGLHRFAKPWWKRRALRIFRDESSLSANPHLWSSITEALDQSRWFVLLLSPDAASSEWVNQEIEYWKQHKDSYRILPVLTDGTFEWTGGDVSGTAVPEQLQGSFSEEPRWVDMRFAKNETDLDIKDPRFAEAVADIASALRGVPKDELASEEVKQHRRTIRIAWAAGVLVLLLGITAVLAAIQASQNAEEARQLAGSEAEARDEADANAERAEANAEQARQAQALAEVSAAEATSLALAARAVTALEEDASLALLLALAAVDSANTPEAVSALRETTREQRLVRAMTWPEGRWESGMPVNARISPDGSRVFVISHGTRLPPDPEVGWSPIEIEMWAVDGAEPMWTVVADWMPGAALGFSDWVDWLDNSHIVLDVGHMVQGEQGLEVEDAWLQVLDADTGAVTQRIDGSNECDNQPLPATVDQGRILSMLVSSWEETVEEDGSTGCNTNRVVYSVLDVESGDRTELGSGPHWWDQEMTVSRKAGIASFRTDAGIVVVDVATGEERLLIEGIEGVSAVSESGRLGAAGAHQIQVRDLDTGEFLASLLTQSAIEKVGFSSDDQRIVGTSIDGGGTIEIFNADLGQQRVRIATPYRPWSVDWDDDLTLAVISQGFEDPVYLWDLEVGLRGEVDYELPESIIPDPQLREHSVGGDRLLLSHSETEGDWLGLWSVGHSHLVDMETGATVWEGRNWTSGLSPDGSMIALHPVIERLVTAPSGKEGAALIGPLQVIDADTGDVVVELGTCTMYVVPDTEVPEIAEDCEEEPTRGLGYAFSGDGSRLAVLTWGSGIVVHDLPSGDEVFRIDQSVSNPQGQGAVALSEDGRWLAYPAPPRGATVITDLDTGETIPLEEERWADWVMRFDRSADRLYFGSGERIIEADVATGEIVREIITDHGSSIRGIVIDDERGLLHSGGTSDEVFTWDLMTGALAGEINVGPLENGVVDLEIIGSRLMVAGLLEGPAFFELDTKDVLERALALVKRGFSEAECDKVGLSECPTTVEAVKAAYGRSAP